MKVLLSSPRLAYKCLVLLIYLTHLHAPPEIFTGIMQSGEHCTTSQKGMAIKGGTSSYFLLVGGENKLFPPSVKVYLYLL